LGEVVVNSLELTDVDVGPCPYKILTSMGDLKKVQKSIGGYH
jgi:hypothetical protein